MPANGKAVVVQQPGSSDESKSMDNTGTNQVQ